MRKTIMAVAVAMMASHTHAQAVDPRSISALDAVPSGWDAAQALAEDALTRDVLTWMRLREGEATLAEYQAFFAARPDWPDQDKLRGAAEEGIEKGHDPEAVIAWFSASAPRTGTGALRLAEALTTTGQRDAARIALRDAWLSLSLSDEEHAELMAAFADVLAPFHVARTDAMLWRWRTSDAERMLELLDNDQRALAAARIAYIRKSGDHQKLFMAVPAGLREDAGLAYDRYNWLADRGSQTDAVAILSDRSTSRAALGDPFRWSGWRRSLARWEMREGRAEQAYRLASRHYLTDGEAFADLEWLSGYIALTYLGDPAAALAHFETAARIVDGPISAGRMHYWIGRTQEVLGDQAQAAAAYGRAAAHQTGFYGLLAAEKLGQSLDPTLAGATTPGGDGAVFQEDLTRAAFMLLAAGERGHAVTFFAALGRELEPEALGQLGAVLDALDEQYYVLLLAKTAVTRGIIIPAMYFPIHDLASMDLPVDPALALSIARRESEFNTTIGSPVGALGLMQLMPATAEEVAGELGMPYARARLTNDWRYNATLGATYLATLQAEFGPTPVMIAAGYNAGPSRPKAWMDERGDPRLGEMDVIDWIEHIPFTETRNYVQRVAESIPIYQARLTGQAGPIAFTSLLEGEKPLLRPRLRPLPQEVKQAPDMRPMLRPERG